MNNILFIILTSLYVLKLQGMIIISLHKCIQYKRVRHNSVLLYYEQKCVFSPRDNDGIQDNYDNCEYIPNADQLDTDYDNIGLSLFSWF
jgi:hypothetical protein